MRTLSMALAKRKEADGLFTCPVYATMRLTGSIGRFDDPLLCLDGLFACQRSAVTSPDGEHESKIDKWL